MRDYHKLRVWRDSHRLACDVIRAVEGWPVGRQMTLGRELARSAISVPSNLAEGSARPTKNDYARFVAIAAGSASELQYQLELATELGWLSDPGRDLVGRSSELKGKLIALRRAIRDHLT